FSMTTRRASTSIYFPYTTLFRSGVKVIYPHKPAPKNRREAAKGELIEFIEKHDIDTIAIGNGTASRESEQFVADLLKEMNRKIRSEEHTSELQSRFDLVCRLLLE